MDKEEFLTTKELSRRVKMATGTIRNLVWQKRLVQGVHFVKPTPRKTLFIWSAVEAWLYGGPSSTRGLERNTSRSQSLIHI
jgi:hypothetical protein